MKRHIMVKMVFIVFLITFLSGFGLGDMNKTPVEKIDSNQEIKKQTIKLKSRDTIAGTASRIIANMAIQHKAEQLSPEDKIIKDYVAKHTTLPKDPKLVQYSTKVKPGSVVKPGTVMEFDSNMLIVPGKSKREVFIKERIAIYDKIDKSKIIKTLIRAINDKTKRAGAFSSQFSFTLPGNMPKGIYPVRTSIIVNGKEFKPNDNKMQLVLIMNENRQYKIAATEQ